jgi:hypothetical protein
MALKKGDWVQSNRGAVDAAAEAVFIALWVTVLWRSKSLN